MGAFRHLRPTGSSGAPGDPEIWGQDGESGGARVGGTPGGLYPEAGDPEDGSERRRLLTNVVAYPKGGGARGGQDGGDRVGCHGEGDGCDAAEMDVENGVLEPRDDRGGEGGGWRPVEDRVGAGVGVREECQRDGAERRGGGEKRALASSQMYECGSDVLIERGRRDAEISIRLWAPGLAASTILCVCVINGMLGCVLARVPVDSAVSLF